MHLSKDIQHQASMGGGRYVPESILDGWADAARALEANQRTERDAENERLRRRVELLAIDINCDSSKKGWLAAILLNLHGGTKP